jgi:pyridoxamine 5'-phosphate oxidase
MNTYQGFNKEELNYSDPLELFNSWFEEEKKLEINDPNAMALATANKEGLPNVRMVLLKGVDTGLVFYTNKNSQKGTELDQNSNAALCFHWKSIRKQVRFRGKVSIINSAESDTYFNSRPRGSRIGAIVSKQSSILESPRTFAEEYKKYSIENENRDLNRPDYWVGYRLIPSEVEFWLNSEFRLHQRLRFKFDSNVWTKNYLYP